MNPVNFLDQYCAGGNNLQTCLQGVYNMGIALAIAVAFLYVVIGSIQYMTGAAINSKEAGKKRILSAIIGLVVIFTSGVALYWINPGIFNAQLIIYRITELQPPVFEQFEQIYGQYIPEDSKNALTNLSFAPGTATGEIIAKIAETIASRDTNYYRTIMSHVKTGTDITSCAIFVNTVLRYANEKTNGKLLGSKARMLHGDGGEFANVLSKQFGWNAFAIGQYPLQRGDILVGYKGGFGHVAVLLGKAGNGYKVAESHSDIRQCNPKCPKITVYSINNFGSKKLFEEVARPR